MAPPASPIGSLAYEVGYRQQSRRSLCSIAQMTNAGVSSSTYEPRKRKCVAPCQRLAAAACKANRFLQYIVRLDAILMTPPPRPSEPLQPQMRACPKFVLIDNAKPKGPYNSIDHLVSNEFMRRSVTESKS
jgi:hypothetical protein